MLEAKRESKMWREHKEGKKHIFDICLHIECDATVTTTLLENDQMTTL